VGTVPPSMTNSVPVIDAARGDTRKATRSATSLGRAGRPIGMPPSESISVLRAPSKSVPCLDASFVDQADSRIGLDPARGQADDANALRAHLLRQTLAVVRERAFAAAYASVASGSGNRLWME